ncbi:MAG: hypothetical protein H7069_02710 [Phormidesmis sp. FL-bin-119]|nr:hypothetical protein [Pedobacter sp.]
MNVSVKDKARLYCQISGGRVLRLAKAEEILKSDTQRTYRDDVVNFKLVLDPSAHPMRTAPPVRTLCSRAGFADERGTYTAPFYTSQALGTYLMPNH